MTWFDWACLVAFSFCALLGAAAARWDPGLTERGRRYAFYLSVVGVTAVILLVVGGGTGVTV